MEKPIARGYILCSSIDATFLKWQTYTDGEEVCDCQRLRSRWGGVKGDVIIKGSLEASLCAWNILSLGCIKVSFFKVIGQSWVRSLWQRGQLHGAWGWGSGWRSSGDEQWEDLEREVSGHQNQTAGLQDKGPWPSFVNLRRWGPGMMLSPY